MNRCPACGTTFVADARFCPRDGTRLVAVLAAKPAAPAAPPTPGTPTPARPTVAPARGDLSARQTLTPGSLVGKTLEGRYRMVSKVGEGGMSYVNLAEDIATRERYAIKVLSPSLSEDVNAMARLRREAALGMRLAHPNVCHIMRLGETEDGLVYVVMPFVEGELLADRTQRLGTNSLAETARFVNDMASGLHLAHQLKIVHRDLKPENVMISRRPDGVEFAVVMDFGLAKERKAEGELQKLTATGIILGTPEFMSPEQLRGKTLDARTDIYSLGLLVYEMLTGKLPFQGRTQQEMMIARLRSDPIPLRRMRPELNLPESVERVLVKAMQRDPEDRYQTTLEFADAFAAAASGNNSGESRILGKLFGR
jgi:eukaryotic-like serine/threonine-protein kinase